MGGPEGPRTLPWLQAGPWFSPSGARLFYNRSPAFGNLMLAWVAITPSLSSRSMFFGLSVALIQSLYWGPHNLLGPHQYVCGALSLSAGPSAGMIWLSVGIWVPQMSMWTANLWGPQYDMALSRCGCGAIGCVDGQWICGTFFCMWGPLWIGRVFGMTWLLVVVRGPRLSGWSLVNESVGPSSVCRVLSQSARPSVWHDSQSSTLSRFFESRHGPPSQVWHCYLFYFLFWIWGPTRKIVDHIRWVFSFWHGVPEAPRKSGPLREEILDTPLKVSIIT